MDKDVTAFTAGTSDEHHNWVNATYDVLDYDDYIEIISMIVDDMKDDVRKVDSEQFTDDMEDIIRTVTKKSKNPRKPKTPEDIKIPELSLKEIASNKKVKIVIKLEDLNKVSIHNNNLSIVTRDRFINLMPRDTYQTFISLLSKREVNEMILEDSVQYIAYSYSSTIASIQKIVGFASQYNLLEDDRSTKDMRHVFDSLGDSTTRSQSKANIIDFNKCIKKE